MLLTIDEFKLVMPDGTTHFKAKDNLTKKEKKKLLKLDKWYFEIHGEHLISNYDELMQTV